MQVLPLKFIHHDDKKIVGANLFNLAQLKHLGLPVIESVIVFAPSDSIRKIIRRYSSHNMSLYDHKNNLRQEILGIEMPDALLDLEMEYLSQRSSQISIDIKKLWQNLLEKWGNELFLKLDRGEKHNFNFTPQQVIFSSNFESLGRGFFDEDRDHVVIETNQGKLDFNKSQELEKLILLGNKKLMLPQIFYWAVEQGKIKIIKLAPFTQSLPKELNEVDEVKVYTGVKNSKVAKTATKILLDFKSEVLNDSNADAVFLRVGKTDPDSVDNLINKISTFIRYPKVIFYLDFNNETKIFEFAKTFLFYRNKRKMEVQIVLPQTFSKDEFLNLKREFASLGIYSKGSLKLWKEFSNVQDFLNLEDYLEAGFDGAVINLDKIAKVVTGLDSEVIISNPKLDSISAIEKFFKEMKFSELMKEQKPVLIIGTLARNEDILNYLIKSGVWGIAFENNIIDPMREHIAFLEKQIVKKLTKVN